MDGVFRKGGGIVNICLIAGWSPTGWS